MKRVVVSVTNDISHDQRVQRACSVLQEHGYSVLIIGRRRKWSKNIRLPFRTFRFRLFFNSTVLFYADYNLRLFFKLLFTRADLLWSNDLDTLLPNYLVSRIRRIPLVYDSHEYFCHVPELLHRPAVRNFWLMIERSIFPKLMHVVTVNDSIADQYNKEYKKRPIVIRNMSSRERASKALQTLTSREHLGLPSAGAILILQGTGININRGAEEAILAMQFVKDATLVFIGGGDAWDYLRQFAIDQGLQDRVLFFQRQPYEIMLQYTAHADLGLSLDKPDNPNYIFSLPNKIFDYLQAGIPTLASDLPEVRAVVEGYGIGAIVEDHDPKKIAEAINLMLEDERAQIQRKLAIQSAQKVLSWENESKKLDTLIHAVES